MSKYVIRKGIHYGTADDMVHRIEELEAKLAKAVNVLDRIQHGSYGKNAAIARTTLAELTGGNDE